MKRYQFRLDHLLRVRQAQEEMALQRLAAANIALRQAVAASEAQLERYLALYEGSQALDVTAFRAEWDQRERHAAMLAEARRIATEAAAAASARSQEWAAARRRVKALERLDARRRQEYEVEVGRAEAAMVDDISTTRWIAAHSEESGELTGALA